MYCIRVSFYLFCPALLRFIIQSFLQLLTTHISVCFPKFSYRSIPRLFFNLFQTIAFPSFFTLWFLPLLLLLFVQSRRLSASIVHDVISFLIEYLNAFYLNSFPNLKLRTEENQICSCKMRARAMLMITRVLHVTARHIIQKLLYIIILFLICIMNWKMLLLLLYDYQVNIHVQWRILGNVAWQKRLNN